MQNNYETIKSELLLFNEQSIEWPEWPEKRLYENDTWSIIPLFAFGRRVNRFTKHFKNTIDIIQKIPNVQTILFSKSNKFSVIKEHQGWANLSNRILRTQLPIIVGENNYLGVQNKKKYHEKGKLIIFDDSKKHYAINNSDIDRIVLIVDILRPSWVEKGKSTIEDSPELNRIIEEFI